MMVPQDPNSPEGSSREVDNPEDALRDARQRFIAAFPKRSDSIGLLLGMVATLGPRGPLAPLRQIVHRTAGLAGTLGFPSVSDRARELEDLLEHVEDKGVDTHATDLAFDEIGAAFAHDLSSPPDWVQTMPHVEGQGRLVLLVEDDEDQREVLSIHLKSAGYQPVHVSDGDKVIDAANARQPDIILLDANLPGMDGYAVCRLLKTQAHLASIPVIFLTVRASLDDKLVGLMLGADDYLVKPVDMSELLLRMQLLLTKRSQQDVIEQGRLLKESPELDFETFSLVAHEELAMLPATLVLVRTPEDLLQPTYAALRAESRRRDLVARYDATHIVLLMGEMPPQKARDRLADMLERVRPGTPPRIQVGLASSPRAGARSFETLLEEADKGVSMARDRGELIAIASEPAPQPEPSRSVFGAAPPPPPAIHQGPSQAAPAVAGAPQVRRFTILLADDDPEVSTLVDAQAQASGFRTVLAADGVEALAAVELHKPDAMVIDLKISRMNGLEVLAKLAQVQNRPRIIVLSARGREQDVTRAFALGADDYLTKPFSPLELVARLKRLLR
jgi:DNA-binding response OmpR family regulator/HPt (histidine-containing phosphotransfer) domain-containing protein